MDFSFINFRELSETPIFFYTSPTQPGRDSNDVLRFDFSGGYEAVLNRANEYVSIKISKVF